MISVPQLLIILAIVLVLFGAKKLRNIGADLGGAIKNFRSSMKEGGEEGKAEDKEKIAQQPGQVIEGEATVKEKEKV
ncbi:MAG: Sec-independent protein translocase subunit TatA [Gammaproteobacteria bacterium]|nr:Sec-independent protein translocase subunit TatA [Gammaproteobacteria bacterium]MCL5669595.1 Sec-independent protein translocase subunit TatA [Gammaproteobacteria bacterium]RJQ47565.1 MAG: Sec-independent protein translocase subunit TatA [Gammaproteobacteria bacterium]